MILVIPFKGFLLVNEVVKYPKTDLILYSQRSLMHHICSQLNTLSSLVMSRFRVSIHCSDEITVAP